MSIEAMKKMVEALEDLMGWQTLAPAGTQRDAHNAIKIGRQAIAEAEKQEPVAAQIDAVFAASIEFIGTLTGMQPPPIETAPPEVFKPFWDFTQKICSIFFTSPKAEKQEPVNWKKLYELEVLKKQRLQEMYERDVRPLTKIVPMSQTETEKQEPVVGTKTWFEDGKVVTQNLHASDIYKDPPQRQPLTHEQRLDLHMAFEPHKSKWNAQSILIDMVEAAHGIKGEA